MAGCPEFGSDRTSDHLRAGADAGTAYKKAPDLLSFPMGESSLRLSYTVNDSSSDSSNHCLAHPPCTATKSGFICTGEVVAINVKGNLALPHRHCKRQMLLTTIVG